MTLMSPGSFQCDILTVLHHKNLPTDEQVISIGDLTMFMQCQNSLIFQARRLKFCMVVDQDLLYLYLASV